MNITPTEIRTNAICPVLEDSTAMSLEDERRCLQEALTARFGAGGSSYIGTGILELFHLDMVGIVPPTEGSPKVVLDMLFGYRRGY